MLHNDWENIVENILFVGIRNFIIGSAEAAIARCSVQKLSKSSILSMKVLFAQSLQVILATYNSRN